MPDKSPWFRKKEIKLTFHFREPDPLSDLIFHIVCLVVTVFTGSFLIYQSLSSSLFYTLFYVLFVVSMASIVMRGTQRSLKRYREKQQNQRDDK
jgi:hypothetical protein